MGVFIVLQKILSMFLIIFIGVFAYKIKWFPEDTEKHLTTMMLNITGPCLIFYSMETQPRTAESIDKATQALVLMTVFLVLCCFLAVFIVKLLRAPRSDRGVYRLMVPFTNVGFMGYPLSLAVFGEEGLFYTIIANMSLNVIIFSLGAVLLIYDMEEKLSFKESVKKIISVQLIAAIIGLFIFYCGIKFPVLLEDTFGMVGNMTAPLAMLIIGLQLARSSVGRITGNKRLMVMTAVRLVLIPAFLFFGMRWIPVDPMVFCTIVYVMCMPAGVFVSVLATRYNSNTVLAAEGVFMTTLLSLLTTPVWGIALTAFLAAG